ncbi:hypothetical protein CBM2589_U10233 [Cupriavidus taiwanensis]|uniref:Uncharacterized protein n=1 Tax=Cupriavidus taiwanensis TaxID=164546 RepID=A0A375CRJ9_9BURK|nr:hypothetical protein CBM2589_U10233 [Cupriavidus taiwanensis]
MCLPLRSQRSFILLDGLPRSMGRRAPRFLAHQRGRGARRIAFHCVASFPVPAYGRLADGLHRHGRDVLQRLWQVRVVVKTKSWCASLGHTSGWVPEAKKSLQNDGSDAALPWLAVGVMIDTARCMRPKSRRGFVALLAK